MSAPVCKHCLHYRAGSDRSYDRCTVTMKVTPDLVRGGNIETSQTRSYCTDARMSMDPNECGPAGTYFVAKDAEVAA